MISQPKTYPRGLLEALDAWIKRTNEIENVFVGLHTLNESEQSLVAILKCSKNVDESKHHDLMVSFSEVAQAFLGDQMMDMDFFSKDYLPLCERGELIPVSSGISTEIIPSST